MYLDVQELFGIQKFTKIIPQFLLPLLEGVAGFGYFGSGHSLSFAVDYDL